MTELIESAINGKKKLYKCIIEKTQAIKQNTWSSC